MIIVEGYRSPSHDGGVAIYNDGHIVSLAAERIDRIKHSCEPRQAYAFLHERLQLGQKKVRDFFPHSGEHVSEINHPLAHAASAYYCSGFDRAIIVVVDGQGRYDDTFVVATTVWLGEAGKIRELLALTEPAPFCVNSLGHFYSAVTYYLGFGFYDQGKTMALAPLGSESAALDVVRAFCSCQSLAINTDERFIKSVFYNRFGFGPDFGWDEPTGYKETMASLQRALGPMRGSGAPFSKQHYDLAFAGQRVLEDVLVAFCRNLFAKYKVPNLCLAGGVALNVAANTRVLRESGFSRVFIQPAAGDDGQALGRLLFRMHNHFGLNSIPMRNAYLGPAYTQTEIQDSLAVLPAPFRRTEYAAEPELLQQTVARLCTGKVVAWFHAGSELGPRALGHRSIIANPRDALMKDRLNREVKHREDFQPFALSILNEDCRHWFDLPVESPFMLLVGQAQGRAHEIMPAGLHVDGSSRLQTVTEEDNGIFYRLVKAFKEKTGVPAVLNTSFNDKEEPIVETPQDAIRAFTRMHGIDVLVIGNQMIER